MFDALNLLLPYSLMLGSAALLGVLLARTTRRPFGKMVMLDYELQTVCATKQIDCDANEASAAIDSRLGIWCVLYRASLTVLRKKKESFSTVG